MSEAHYYVPNRTPCWLIFHAGWDVSMRRMHLLTDTDIRTFGVAVSKDQGRESYMNEMAEVRLTLAELAVKYNEGVSFSVRNPPDSVEMYKTLLAHLENARNAYADPLRNRKPPREELKLFDNLANALYDIAGMYENKGVLSGGLMAYLNNVNKTRMGTARLFDENAKNKNTTTSELKYTSPLQSLTSRTIKGGRQWE